jgi:RNA methyltransferase, TrmH family
MNPHSSSDRSRISRTPAHASQTVAGSAQTAITIAMSSKAMKPAAESRIRNIESPQNARVRELRAGLQRGIRSARGQIAIEGDHLLREAIQSGLRARTVFVRRGSENLLDLGLIGDAEVLLLPDKVFSSAAATEHPQGIAALVDAPELAARTSEAMGADSGQQAAMRRMFLGTALVVIAAELKDPGNLGTLVRSAEAFGATGMILLPGTVNLWNPKTLRASSGSAFRLPIAAMTPQDTFAALRANGIRLLAAVPQGGETDADFSGPTALMLGNEGAGLPEDWIARADVRVTIPCPGAVESLNAAVAGSVLLYEAARQRRIQHPNTKVVTRDAGKGRL